jgi:hypothetical protein
MQIWLLAMYASIIYFSNSEDLNILVFAAWLRIGFIIFCVSRKFKLNDVSVFEGNCILLISIIFVREIYI